VDRVSSAIRIKAMRFIVYIAVIFHILLVIGAFMGWFDDYFHGPHHTSEPGLDLHAMYDAGEELLEREPIYKLPPYEKGYTPFRYLPVAALPGMLLSRLDFDMAYIVWFIILEAMMLICLTHLRLFIISDEDYTIAACMYLFFTPFYVELFMGQYSLIQATFILMFFTHLYGMNHRTAYAHWVASTLWKLNTFIVLPVLLKNWKLKPVIWAVGLASTSLLIYSVIVPGNMQVFYAINFRMPAIYQEGNLGLRMLWDTIILHGIGLGHPVDGGGSYELSTGGKVLSMLLPALILGLCFHALFKGKKGKFADLLALWMTAYFLIYTDIWEHHYLMLLPILVMQYTRKHWPLILGCYLFIALPTTFALFGDIPVIYLPGTEGAPPFWTIFLHHATKPLATLVFFLALYRHILTWKPEYGGHTVASADWDQYVRRDIR
jgi:hypothetical protein